MKAAVAMAEGGDEVRVGAVPQVERDPGAVFEVELAPETVRDLVGVRPGLEKELQAGQILVLRGVVEGFGTQTGSVVVGVRAGLEQQSSQRCVTGDPGGPIERGLAVISVVVDRGVGVGIGSGLEQAARALHHPVGTRSP